LFWLGRAGVYRLETRLGRWLRLATLLIMLVGLPATLGAAGFVHGMARALECGARDSPLGKEALPAIGAVCADLLIEIDRRLRDAAPDEDNSFDVAGFLGRVERLQSGLAQSTADNVVQSALDRHPEWRGTRKEELLRFIIPRLANWLAQRRLDQKLADFGMRDLFVLLRSEAERRGQAPVPRAELGAAISERLFVPNIVCALRSWLSGPFWIALGCAAGVVLVPMGTFWLARRWAH
jgi:hypothetical protein